MDNIKIYSLNLASWLASKGFKYKVGNNKKTNKKFFEFNKTKELEREINAYKQSKEVQLFISCFKKIKSEIYK